MAHDLLLARSLTKVFPGTVALDGVDLTLAAGRVTALAGHNGSGKSTLVKTLAGIYRPDGGTIETPGHAHRSEVLHFIHQDLGLIDDLTAVENFNLVHRRGLSGLSNPRRSRERTEAEKLLAAFGVELDVSKRLRYLSPAERTMVAIARAMSRWDDMDQVLVLDEPTATLGDHESEVVLRAIRAIADRGAAVLYISHRLAEIERLADDVVVLRDGRVIETATKGSFTAVDLVGHIAGDAKAGTAERTVTSRSASTPRLVVKGLTAATVHGVDVTVARGEIVGVSGVIGSGVEELLGAIFGARARSSGTVAVDGKAVLAGSVRNAIASGIGYVPADRHRHGAVLGMSASENLTLPFLAPLRRWWGAIDDRAERREALRAFDEASVLPRKPASPFSSFSGGNQQKVIVARWTRTSPKVLLLEEPTQGVDAGAQQSLYELVRRAAATGAAVLVASSDTKELVEICDRVIVLVNGTVARELSGHELHEAAVIRHTLATKSKEM
jgi:ribose transport system ATP-binding protein